MTASRNFEHILGGSAHDEPLFHISVVARMVGVHQQTLRAYERQGLLAPTRTAGNRRMYSPRDVERLRQVLRLVTDLGVNLAGVDVILRLTEQIEHLQRELDVTRSELARARQAGGR
ncbi:MAG: MerR family transcriptional regulator [Chloroflexi bacterium]|nr:MerR family transcriptional regulator [Chloroflexota bacterium]